MAREQNIKTIDLIKNILKTVKLLIIIDIHGICAEDMRYLRRELNKKNQHIKVFKNQLSKQAIKDTPLQILSENIKGQVALIWDSYNTPTSPQVLKMCKNNISRSNIVCGFHNGEKKDSAYIEYLSNLPDMRTLRINLLNIVITIHKKLLFNIKYQAITIINLLKIKSC